MPGYAVIVNFKTGPRTQKGNEGLLRILNGEDYEATSYVGRKVVWITPSNKKVIGVILNIHGRGGVVRARFKRGLPGSALGSKVTVL